jgi:hypothetical protein
MERKSQCSSLALNSGRTGASLKEEEEEFEFSVHPQVKCDIFNFELRGSI